MNRILPQNNFCLFGLPVAAVFEKNCLIQIHLNQNMATYEKTSAGIEPLLELYRQLNAYRKNPEFHFSIPHQLSGTPWQKRVWQSLLSIPPGQTKTYGELARLLGGSAQAVGQALKHNPLPILYPCHRVIAKKGWGGYAGKCDGWQMQFKLALLKHEQGLDTTGIFS